MMLQLQVPGGVELLVIGLIFLIPIAVIGAVVYLLYRISRSPATEADVSTTGRGRTGVDSDQTTEQQTADQDDGGRSDVDGYDTHDSAAGPTHVDQSEQRTLSPSTRRLIDWIVSGALVVVGLCGILLGIAISQWADRDRITELVEDDVIQSDVLSDAALIDLSYASAIWGGTGLSAAGVVVLLAGLVFAGYQLRLKDDRSGDPSMASNALLGAVVTAVASFVPFSAVLGGGVAGYLQQDEPWTGARVGVLTGLFVSLPLFIVLGVLTIGLFIEGFAFLSLVLVVALLFSLLFSVAMSALGGYGGGYLASRK